MEELKREFTIVIVTHNMQQAARVSDRTAFFTAEVDDDGRRAAGSSSTTSPRRSSPTPRDRAPRATSPAGSAEAMSPLRREQRAARRSEQALAGGCGPTTDAAVGRARSASLAALDRAPPTACIVVDVDGTRGVSATRRPSASRGAATATRSSPERSTSCSTTRAPASASRARARSSSDRRARCSSCRRSRSRATDGSSAPWRSSTTSRSCGASRACAATSSPTSATSSRRRSARSGCSPRRWPRQTTPRSCSGSPSAWCSEADRLGAHRRRPARPQHYRGAGGADARRRSRCALLVDEAVDRVQAGGRRGAGSRCIVRRSRPTSRSSCDRRQLRSALANLLDNAIKYSEPGEPVEVGAASSTTASRSSGARPRHRDPDAATSSASSSASTASTGRAAATPAAPGSASRSCATSRRRTAATSPSSRARAKARRSASCCPLAQRPARRHAGSHDVTADRWPIRR